MRTTSASMANRHSGADNYMDGVFRLTNEIMTRHAIQYVGRAKPLIPRSQEKRGPKPQSGINPCTGHLEDCICRACTEDWFYGHLEDDPEPFNFRFCCLVLGLRTDAVNEGIEARREESERTR